MALRGGLREGVLVLWIVTTFFVWGSTYVQGFVNYPYWGDLGQFISNDVFMALREAHYWKIYPLAVYPGLIALLTNVGALIFRHPSVSPILIWIALGLGLIVLIATFAALMPVQDQLDATGYDRRLIEQLIEVDFWFRKIPGTLNCLVLIAVTWQLVRTSRMNASSGSPPHDGAF